MSKIHQNILRLLSCTYHILCVLGLMVILSSCGWHEAKEVIITADSLDQTEHVIYDDTAALGKAINCLDNPFGRVLMSNTLGKAYYYMGRNLEDYHQQVAEAAKCYIEADRLQIDDPIYRGRVNSCMGYICAQNNHDSLSLIFYERACKVFEESDNEWRYAQSLLNIVSCYIDIGLYTTADSLMQIARTFQLGDTYIARYYEKRGLYFEAQQEYDSALVCFKYALTIRKDDEDKLYDYLKVMQAYYDIGDIDQSLSYAQYIVKNSTTPNYLVNAYYCLMQDAKCQNNTELLSYYSHARTDAQKQLRDDMIRYAEALPILEEYLQNPYPWRWVWIVLTIILAVCIILAIGTLVYRQRNRIAREQIVNLSVQLEEQANYLQKQERTSHYEKCLEKIRIKYPAPLAKWNEYDQLKTDVAPYLRDWLQALDQLGLTNREKVFCVFTFVYPQLSAAGLATYLCNTEKTVRVLKTRLVKKLGIPSSQLHFFLQNLSNID